MADPTSFPLGGVDVNKPKRILFVERLIEITSETLPGLWKLGQAYFKRTLFTVSVVGGDSGCGLYWNRFLGKL